jgi:hypothetical protein
MPSSRMAAAASNFEHTSPASELAPVSEAAE